MLGSIADTIKEGLRLPADDFGGGVAFVVFDVACARSPRAVELLGGGVIDGESKKPADSSGSRRSRSWRSRSRRSRRRPLAMSDNSGLGVGKDVFPADRNTLLGSVAVDRVDGRVAEGDVNVLGGSLFSSETEFPGTNASASTADSGSDD